MLAHLKNIFFCWGWSWGVLWAAVFWHKAPPCVIRFGVGPSSLTSVTKAPTSSPYSSTFVPPSISPSSSFATNVICGPTCWFLLNWSESHLFTHSYIALIYFEAFSVNIEYVTDALSKGLCSLCITCMSYIEQFTLSPAHRIILIQPAVC